MALIKCPECGKEVSDQAEVCIHCGYPIKNKLKKQGLEKQEEEINTEAAKETSLASEGQHSTGNSDEKKKHIRNTVIAIAVVAGAIIVLIAVFEYSQHAYSRAQKAAQQSYSDYQNEKSELDELEREKAEINEAIDELEQGTEVVEVLADAYDTYVTPEDTWEYFPQEKNIPVPTSCINGLKDYIYDGGVYTYIIKDEATDSIDDIITAYTTILMKDCGFTLESIDSGVYSVSKNSSDIAICGKGYDSDEGINYLAVGIINDDTEFEDEPDVDITDPIDSSKLISDEDLEADFAEAQTRASLIGEDLQNIWDSYDIYEDEDYGGNFGCLYEKADFWNFSGDFKIQYRKSDNSVYNVYFSWEADEDDIGYVVDCLRRIYGDDYTVTDLSSSNRDKPDYEFRWNDIESSDHFPQFTYKSDGTDNTASICFKTEYEGPSINTEENLNSSESTRENNNTSGSGGNSGTGGRRRPQS